MQSSNTSDEDLERLLQFADTFIDTNEDTPDLRKSRLLAGPKVVQIYEGNKKSHLELQDLYKNRIQDLINVLESHDNDLMKIIEADPQKDTIFKKLKKLTVGDTKLPANASAIRDQVDQLTAILDTLQKWDLGERVTIDGEIGRKQAAKTQNLLRRIQLLDEMQMSHKDVNTAIENFKYTNPKDSQLLDDKLIEYAAITPEAKDFTNKVTCIKNYQTMIKLLDVNTIRNVSCPEAIEQFLNDFNDRLPKEHVARLTTKLESLQSLNK
jgi:hypothetical protein